MPQDYYSDGSSEDSATPMQPEDNAGSPESDNMEQTATIPKSLCPGMKAGEEVVLHIDKVLEDEYLVSYAREKGSEKPEGETQDMGEDVMAPPNSSSMYE